MVRHSDRIEPLRSELETPFPGAVLGNPAGSVTLVEFSDYACTYCRQSVADVAALVAADPDLKVVMREYPMPAGPNGGPYAVTVDGAGRVFASELQSDTVAMLDPKTDAFRVFKLPSKNVGIRKAIVAADGRFWYMGSHNGRLGVIE